MILKLSVSVFAMADTVNHDFLPSTSIVRDIRQSEDGIPE
jgi:hypothetical protein